MRSFGNFLHYLKRQNPSLAYAAIKEVGHHTGMKHLHVILINWNYIPQKQLSLLWAHYSKAPIVHIARISSREVYLYVAKYAAKQMPLWKKCVTFSKNWPKPAWNPPEMYVEKADGPPANADQMQELEDGTLIEKIVPGCDCFTCKSKPPPLPPPQRN